MVNSKIVSVTIKPTPASLSLPVEVEFSHLYNVSLLSQTPPPARAKLHNFLLCFTLVALESTCFVAITVDVFHLPVVTLISAFQTNAVSVPTLGNHQPDLHIVG